jgi:hypothetical protein
MADISDQIDAWCGQHFDPRIATRYFNGEVGATNPKLYLRMQPLLSVTTLLNGDGTAILPANYTLLPRGETPYQYIRLVDGQYWLAPYTTACSDVLLNAAYADDAIAVTGVWGFHRTYSSAWKASGITLGAAITSTTGTTITLSAAGDTIDVGHLIQIDSEWLYVVGPVANTATSLTLTVERGANGSTAATHLIAAPISIWQVERQIGRACRMWVAAALKAQENPTGEVMNITGIGTVSTKDMPEKVKDMLIAPFWNWMYGAAER